ncbi:RNA polymerase sporulation sigma factor SigF [Domibacillus enclensis]|uniref:RNA polymerase sigma-F factor n=1 Tax=Domibacillus enclensis TaxID=1017273 RepID=A0A1N6PD51_9BACI|nr:RNA polymerase sporulation sigma factor SigF [Domibacillus enclensis]OXS80322.1 RNA polymerase sigma-F factor [Domibacillus enclensis]SIQ02263.1 RNA polymerase, sigma subunit, RpoX/SigF [Domibacillus enclensis]
MKQAVQLSDAEVKSLIRKSQNGDAEARNKLVEWNTRLVWSVVHRFLNRGHDAEDLFQIGCIGLLKCIDKFDLSYNVKFSTYAVPMIIGEIQRFLRDDGEVKVSRRLKETAGKMRREREAYTAEFGRPPSIGELAERLDIPMEEALMAQESSRRLASIHETVYENEGEPITILDQLAAPEVKWFDSLVVKEAVEKLPERDQLIVYLRFYKDFTQAETARRLGISQVQVSRLEKQIIKSLRMDMNKK